MTKAVFIKKTIIGGLVVGLAAVLGYAAEVPPVKADGAGGGYLFAHMRTGSEYGHLYFDVSRDGVTWTQLNGGREIPLAPAYLGHPYITEDDNGEFYLIGTTTWATPHDVVVWRSRDLVRWSHVVIDKSHLALPEGFVNETYSYGAVKIFFDRPSRQFMLTWHAERASAKGNTERWESMRTFYVLTCDFKTFTKAASLDKPGPWSEVPLKYDGLIRHGCVIRIGEEVYRGLLAFPAK